MAWIAAMTFRPDFTYEHVAETVALASDWIYGLPANVWVPTAAAVQVTGRIRTETVSVTGGGSMLDHHRLPAKRALPRGRRA